MSSRLLFFVLAAVTSCQVALPPGAQDANFVPSNDTDPAFTLWPPACLVLGAGTDLLINYEVAVPGARLSIERELPDGSFIVLERRDLADALQGSITIVASALALGDNRLVFWVHGKELRSDSISLDVSVLEARDSGSFDDLDGDCHSPRLGDCNDDSAAVFPGQDEVCDDRVDNDCDGLIDAADSSCAGACADSDGDGHAALYCGGDDCDDGRSATFPGATETCNGVDDDCNSQYDEAFDADGDGFVACTNPDEVIVRQVDGAACPAGYSTCADCADDDPNVKPGDAGESCR